MHINVLSPLPLQTVKAICIAADIREEKKNSGDSSQTAPRAVWLEIVPFAIQQTVS